MQSYDWRTALVDLGIGSLSGLVNGLIVEANLSLQQQNAIGAAPEVPTVTSTKDALSTPPLPSETLSQKDA